MEPKTGADGSTYLASSLTKVLTLGTWIGAMVFWYVSPDKVPDMMVYTLWGMLGMKSVQTIGGAIRAGKE